MTHDKPLTRLYAADALQTLRADGFAAFNGGQHLAVIAPDGNFTITVKTSTGERVTFAFCPYRTGGPAGCVDIQRHTETQRHPDRPDLPTFDMIGFGPGTGDPFDTRKIDKRMTLATLLLEDRKAEPGPG